MSTKKQVVIRCGEKNNFNFTARELSDLEAYVPKGTVFVNSNSFVRLAGNFPAIITINPYMQFVEPTGDTSIIKACRIKWVCNANEDTAKEQMKAFKWSVDNGIPALITFFRFMSYNTMNKYTSEDRSCYTYNKGWLRPSYAARLAVVNTLITYVDTMYGKDPQQLVYTCDMEGKGCPSCNNCVRLVTGDDDVERYSVKSLNLSSSGDQGRCIFSCPDCWARHILAITKTKTPKCDQVFANLKQKGKIEHE